MLFAVWILFLRSLYRRGYIGLTRQKIRPRLGLEPTIHNRQYHLCPFFVQSLLLHNADRRSTPRTCNAPVLCVADA